MKGQLFDTLVDVVVAMLLLTVSYRRLIKAHRAVSLY